MEKPLSITRRRLSERRTVTVMEAIVEVSEAGVSVDEVSVDAVVGELMLQA